MMGKKATMLKRIQVFQNDEITVFKTEDLWYGKTRSESYAGKFFVLENTGGGYGFFVPIISAMTRGEVLDKYGILM